MGPDPGPLLLGLGLLWLPAGLAWLPKDGGWLTSRHLALLEEDSCTVEKRDASLTYSQFIQQYAFSRPVILQGITDNSEFQAQCTKEKLLAKFGDRPIRLSTANTYSYRKVDVPFQEYVDQLLEPQDLDSLGSETLYFFGDNNFTEWGPLLQNYVPPPFQIPGTTGAYSFGIAGSGSGVPFHWHGPGFSEVIFGRKRWFLYPPEKTPEFHPNRTTLSWLLDTYPFLPPWERPTECTIHPGEVSRFRWPHPGIPAILYEEAKFLCCKHAFDDGQATAGLSVSCNIRIASFLQEAPLLCLSACGAEI